MRAQLRQLDMEALEIVVVVLALGVVMAGALGEIVLGRGPEAEQNPGIDGAEARRRRP